MIIRTSNPRAAAPLLVLLLLMLAGCTAQSQIQPELYAEEPTEVMEALAGPISTITGESPSEQPASPIEAGALPPSAPTEIPAPKPPPPLYYIQENRLIKLVAGEAPQTLGEVAEAGPVKNLIQVGDTLLALREQGIQRINLADSSNSLLLAAESRVLFGDFFQADPDQVVYSAVVDDPGAAFGFRTWIGAYQIQEDRLQPRLSLPENLRLLGMSSDGSGLYVLPVGQDPDFASVILFDLASGERVKELPIQGSGFASLAPDGRLLATASLGCLSCDPPEAAINLYDLPSLPLTPPRSLALPQAPSHLEGLFWSPDGDSLYFLLNPGSPWDDPLQSDGLWRLQIASGEFTQVSPVDQAAFHLRSLSPDGQWSLLEHESKPEALLVNLFTGEILAITHPEGAQAALWR